MGLLKRKGIYYLEYKDGLKYKRLSLKTKNKELAQKMYESYLLSQITNKFNNSISSRPAFEVHTQESNTLAQDIKPRKAIYIAFQEYLDLCISQNLSQGVIKSKERLNKLFKENKIKYLDEINQKVLNEIVNRYQKDTANRYIKNLKAFLNFCIKKRYFKREDFEVLTFVRQDDNVRDTVVTDSDYQKLVDNTNDEDFKLYMMTLWETGVRPNEIVKLQKKDIDFKNGTAKIFQTKTKKYKTVYLTDELLTVFDGLQIFIT